VIDAEAIVCDDNGLAVFVIRGHSRDGRAILCAFDLLEVNGEDVRAELSTTASAGWPDCRACHTLASRSMRPIAKTVRSSTNTLARSAVRALCRNGSAHPTAPAARNIGSRSRTQRRRRFDGSKRRLELVRDGAPARSARVMRGKLTFGTSEVFRDIRF
jgi:hypothetical protein